MIEECANDQALYEHKIKHTIKQWHLKNEHKIKHKIKQWYLKHAHKNEHKIKQ